MGEFLDTDPERLDATDRQLWYSTADFMMYYQGQLTKMSDGPARMAGAKAAAREIGQWIGGGFCHSEILEMVFAREFVLLLDSAKISAAAGQLKPKTKKDKEKFDRYVKPFKPAAGRLVVHALSVRHPTEITTDAAARLVDVYCPVQAGGVLHWTQPRWAGPCPSIAASAWREAWQALGWAADDGKYLQSAPRIESAVFGAVREAARAVRAGGAGLVDGVWIDNPGLSDALGYYCLDDARAEDIEVAEAEDRLWNGLFKDFPLTQPDARRRVLAAILTAFSLCSFTGPLPAFLITAHNAGDGKTLLAEVIATLADGKNRAPLVPWNDDQDRLRESLLSALDSPARVVIIDNVRGRLGGSILETILTTAKISGAQKYQPTRTYDCRKVFLITGNDPNITTDMARRLVSVEVDRAGALPPEDLPDVLLAALEQRGEWVGCIRAIVSAWDGGRRGIAGCRSFERWGQLIGGILGTDWAPIDAHGLALQHDLETMAWREVLDVWASSGAEGKPLGARDLIAATGKHCWQGLARGIPGDMERAIGRILSGMDGRVIGEYRIVRTEIEYYSPDGKRTRPGYCLERVDGTKSPGDEDVPF